MAMKMMMKMMAKKMMAKKVMAKKKKKSSMKKMSMKVALNAKNVKKTGAKSGKKKKGSGASKKSTKSKTTTAASKEGGKKKIAASSDANSNMNLNGNNANEDVEMGRDGYIRHKKINVALTFERDALQAQGMVMAYGFWWKPREKKMPVKSNLKSNRK